MNFLENNNLVILCRQTSLKANRQNTNHLEDEVEERMEDGVKRPHREVRG